MSISAKKIVFNFKTKYLRKGKNTYYSGKDIPANQNIQTLNFQKRNNLVKHAVLHTKYYMEKYKDYFSHGLENELDFEKLPVLTRLEIKNNFSEIKSNKIYSFWYPKITTSGSTGLPITVLHNRRFAHASSQWRLLNWWGVNSYDNKAFIYRFPRNNLKKILNSILWWPTKRIFLAGSDMNEQNTKKFISDFNRIKPAVLQGYVDVVYEFALFLLDHNLRITPPKVVWVTASPLTKIQRDIMQKVFEAPVFDQYGCSEIPYVAAECSEHKGLHIMQDLVHVECVDENNRPLPPNKWGRILLTDLHNFAFPLIRYDIGDFGRLLDYKCSCGITLPLMDNIRGRASEFIETPSGQRIYGDFLTSIFDNANGKIRNFQIVQNKDYSIQLKYVPFENKNVDEIVAKAVSEIYSKTNTDIEVTALNVDEIPKTEGKTKLIINLV